MCVLSESSRDMERYATIPTIPPTRTILVYS